MSQAELITMLSYDHLEKYRQESIFLGLLHWIHVAMDSVVAELIIGIEHPNRGGSRAPCVEEIVYIDQDILKRLLT